MLSQRWAVIWRFLLLFFFLTIAIAVVLFLFYRVSFTGEEHLVKNNQKDILRHMKDISVADFGSVVSDLMFLSEHKLMQDYLKNPSKTNAGNLAAEYISFSTRKGVYDQIRFIDAAGMERVRVNYNAGAVSSAPAEKLQSKAGRYYVKETLALLKDKVFVSPLDLNVEGLQIEHPLKPVMRFGTPVFDGSGKLRGMMLINYLAQRFIDRLGNYDSSLQHQFALLNEDGYYLRGLDDSKLWGFMLEGGRGNTFQSNFKEEWVKISEGDQGQFYTAEGLFTYVTIYPVLNSLGLDAAIGLDGNEPGYSWKMVTLVPVDVINGLVNTYSYFLIAAFLIVFMGLGLWYLAFARLRRLYAEKELKKVNESLEIKVAERTETLNTLNVALEDEASRLAEFIKVVDKINNELITSNKYKTIFLANISHEMKTPLNHIITSAELLNMQGCGWVTDDCKKYLSNIKGGGMTLLEFIDDLLELTRADSCAIDPNMAKFDVKEVLEEVIRKVKSLTIEKKQEFDLSIDKELGLVRGEAGMIKQIFLNLLENAVKFTPDGGKIYLEVTKSFDNKKEYLKALVRDSGVGICAGDIDRIFHPFEIGERETVRNYQGVGVGLALVKRFVEYHGGEIWVESNSDDGTTFEFYIPLGLRDGVRGY